MIHSKSDTTSNTTLFLTNQLDLLFRMTNAVNVEFIVEKLLSYLPEGSSDDHFRSDLVTQISQVEMIFFASPSFFPFFPPLYKK